MRTRGFGIFLAIGLVSTLTFSTGCRNEIRRRQVVFVLIDALRPDRLSGYGYHRTTSPELDALAERGLLFEEHFAQATHTRESLPQMLYSRYFTIPIFPLTGVVPFSEPDNLFFRLDEEAMSLPRALAAASGMKTAMISTHSWLRAETQLAAEFDEIHDLTVLLSGYRGAPSPDQCVDYSIDWLSRQLDSDYFLYIHIMGPHAPLAYGASAQTFFGDSPPPASRFSPLGHPNRSDVELSPEERLYLDALYDGAVFETDAAVGRLVAFLRDRGRLDSTLLIVTSDHGEHLQHVPGRLGHGGLWYDRVARVPLMISYPSATGHHRITGVTEGVDVFPTIFDLLGLTLPTGVRPDGSSLTPVVDGSRVGKQHAVGPRAIRSARYKALFNASDHVLLAESEPHIRSLRGALFDLRSDPFETRNIWNEAPGLAQNLLQRYRERLRGPFQRHLATRTAEQPKLPFAISVQHLQTEPPAMTVSTVLEDFACGQDPTETGWVRSNHWDRYFLAARPDAQPLRFSMSIPNGRYLLSAQALGSGAFELESSTEVMMVNGTAADVAHLGRTDASTIGIIEIDDELFQGTLRPSGTEGCLVVRHLSFVPIRPGVEARYQEDVQRLENLRALGYIQ